METTRVALETLGCKLNQAESEKLAREFIRAGCIIVPAAEKADIYILNSCTVTHIADRKARHWLRMARRLNPSAFIVITGCYAQRDAEALSRMEEVDLVVGNEEKAGLPEKLAGMGRLRLGGMGRGLYASARTRSFIEIQDGCSSYCAYCIVPLVRGKEKSLPPERILNEVIQRTREGFREAVLTGTEVGRYKYDNLDLKGLLERILKETDISRLRLSSLQPGEITPELINLWWDPRLCPHFHISLQSGSDSELHRMGRRYTTREYAAAVGHIRSQIPDVSITTDVIAGFPGETEEEFKQSYAFCENSGFARIHVFPFSPRRGTAAGAMPGQVPEAAKRSRSAALLALGRSSLQDFNRKFLGRTRPVLFEQQDEGWWVGLTDNYIRVYGRSEADLTNRIADVKLGEVRGEGVEGIIS